MRTDETLAVIVETLQKNCGDMMGAAREAGVSPHFLLTWLRDDKEAAKIVEEAQKVGWMGLESEATRRAVEGVDKGIYFKGLKVATEKQYSDTLLAKLMDARIPEYKKGDSNNTFNGPTQINVMPRAETYDEWLKMKDVTLERRAQQAIPAPLPKLPEILQGEYVEITVNPLEGFGI